MISKYIENTHGPTHSFKLTIEYVYEARRLGEFQRYEPNMSFGNRKLLWHGTKRSNFQSILANGLSTQPPSTARIHGKMFGDGIYFTDVVTKAAGYCETSRSDPYGILILAEVALGKHYYLKSAKTVTDLKYGKKSVKGLGKYKPDRTETVRTEHHAHVPLGKLQFNNSIGTSLDYSEYIVYDDDQVYVEYLVLVKFHF
ncbi:poly [ADP-ribose] polymerase 1-like [Condylostylus longicornis]|uniref:poly [ADP-ribose] polymerase 1-like n=1 Tax=Condylostylus longicornis TaxID=2530218 RepID=UPI00244DEC7D|nr:poly [ADP-ribose] polymerase 1-like [Condylostylus longicornis]